MQTSIVTCKNCGNSFQGEFCNNCGEKVYDEHDKKISHFVEEALHFTTHFDSKFFRSFWLMFAKPGFVAKEYADGKRKKYFSPVSMYLIGVVIYLLFPLLQGMNISFADHISMNNKLHFYALRNWVIHKSLVNHISLEEIAERFNHLSPKFSKILMVLLIPLSALGLTLLFRRRKTYFFDHLILGAEFNSFYLFFSFLILPLLIGGISTITGANLDTGDNALFLSIQGAIVLLALTASFKRFYKVKLPEALLKAILFIAFYILITQLYRYIIFTAVMLFIQ